MASRTLIVTGRRLEGCLEQAPQFEYVLAEPVAEELVHRLAKGGVLQYFPDFPRPYFRINRPRGVVVQGVVGQTLLRASYSRADCDDEESELRRAVEGGVE